jgi:hypothetical protein
MGNVMTGPSGDLFGLSQDLWKDVPVDRIFGGKDRDIGWGLRDDFSNFAADAGPSSGTTYYKSEGNSYKVFETRGSTSVAACIPNEAGWTIPSGFNVFSPNGNSIILPAGAVVPTPGAVKFTMGAASDEVQMCLAANQARASAAYPPGCFTPYPITSGVQGDVLFECRLMLDGLTTGFTSFFVGLVSTLAPATAALVGTTTYSTTPARLGFGCLSGDPSGNLGLVWNQAGQAVQWQYISGTTLKPLNLLTMGGISGITPITSPATYPNVFVGGAGGVPAATPSTYVGAYLKLGFRYSAKSKMLTPYINGVAQDGRGNSIDRRVIATLGIQGVTTYGYPGHSTLWPAAPMTFGAGCWQTSTTYQSPTIDWWQAVQLAG